MKTSTFTQSLVDTLLENKAFHIVELDLRSLTDIADSLVISSTTSRRHAMALADKIIAQAKQGGTRPLGVEGQDLGEWILIDLEDVIVHIMLPEVREFYNLEKLWSISQTTRRQHDPV